MSAPQSAPNFLSLDEVLLLHAVAIDEFGGQAGGRDVELLKSAVAQAEAGAFGEYLNAYPFEMAASYGLHLAKNHPFFDGNKRAAWSAVRVFLYKNGLVVRASTDEAVRVMLQLATGEIDKTGFASWLAAHSAALGE